MRKWIPFLAALAAATAAAGERGSPAAAVVELFTSQGCYSCPPADRLLGELIERRTDVVALEFHVDYWDDLVYGSAGSWRDPFSSAAYSKRQRDYDAAGVAGRRGVYTPQVVVNGRRAQVGSDRDAVYGELKQAVRLPVDVYVKAENDVLAVRIDGGRYRGPADIWRVDILPAASTPVNGGENNGKVLRNHHVVIAMHHLGRWWGASPKIELTPPSGAELTCAVLVQEPAGAIVGAAYCPS